MTNIERYLHKIVKIKLFDDDILIGYLYREEDFPNDPNKLRDGGFVLKNIEGHNDLHFRKSHIKKIEFLRSDLLDE